MFIPIMLLKGSLLVFEEDSIDRSLLVLLVGLVVLLEVTVLFVVFVVLLGVVVSLGFAAFMLKEFSVVVEKIGVISCFGLLLELLVLLLLAVFDWLVLWVGSFK